MHTVTVACSPSQSIQHLGLPFIEGLTFGQAFPCPPHPVWTAAPCMKASMIFTFTLRMLVSSHFSQPAKLLRASHSNLPLWSHIYCNYQQHHRFPYPITCNCDHYANSRGIPHFTFLSVDSAIKPSLKSLNKNDVNGLNFIVLFPFSKSNL